MSLLEVQYEQFEELNRGWRNFNKDGKERKTNSEYFKKQRVKLEELWANIQQQHERICTEVSRLDPYFTDDKLGKTREVFVAFQRAITSGLEHLTTYESSAPEKSPRTVTRPLAEVKSPAPTLTYDDVSQKQETHRQFGSNSKLDESLKRQDANFRAFARTVSNLNKQVLVEKWEFEDAIKNIESRWSAIDRLHWEIDSELNGSYSDYETLYTQYEEQYNTLKKGISGKMWSASYREKCAPKIEIPTFSGNYNNWISFKDLFVEAVHNNPTMPSAQKMQILKSKVRGEAERLIQHLFISSENYMSCWDILNNRYNNIKLIFTSHMNVLFGLPNIQHNSLMQIKRMHDVTLETLNAIKNLGVETSTWDPILVHLLTQKMDSETYTNYLDSVKQPRELPKLQELLHFLESRFTNLETTVNRKQGQVTTKTAHVNNKQQFTYNKPAENYNKNNNWQSSKSYHVSGIKCPLCKSHHGIYNCKSFLQLTDEKKLGTVQKLGLCINCLFSHNGKTCTSTYSCRVCSSKHSTLLHEALQSANNKASTSKKAITTTNNDNITGTSHVSQEAYSEILLATAQLQVQGADGRLHNLRALIDQGSQISLITEHAAQALGIKREKCQGVIFGVGERQNNCKGKIKISCSSLYGEFQFKVEVIIMNQLIKNLPNKTFNKPSWSNIKNINLADPEFFVSRPVDLLLGAEVYSKIMMNGMIKGYGDIEPMAQQTQLGWLLCGNAQTFHCNVVINNLEDIQQFWEVEDIMGENSDMTSEDIQCVQIFNETTTRNEEGRYEVRLPMKPNFEKQLGESKQKAIAQFRNLERKIVKNESMASSYSSFMREYEELKHMKLSTGNTKPECFLPHHGIERVDSTTTKYRVVFNASSKNTTGCSLNDLMYKGPNLQQDLQNLILRWRQYKYAFTADIEKMYRQILTNQQDTPLQKIIWRESPDQPLKIFELNTVTYGTKAAPFLAMMTLKRLAKDEQFRFPEAANVLEESFYMDDLVHGTHHSQEGQQLVNDLGILLESGGFHLRKWCTNHPKLLVNIPTEQKTEQTFDFKNEDSTKTLGLCWNPRRDTFTFKCQISDPKKLTKRSLLSEVSKIFDPLGWLAPIVVKLKLLFQKVWKTNIGWDEPVSADICLEWKKLQAEIHDISKFETPRWLGCTETDVIELHGFCDASTQAYAGVVYARVRTQSEITLVAAKTKVVPLNKKLTLPRLELSGALLLSKLMSKIKTSLTIPNIKTYGWTDSKIVLGWLQGKPSQWKTFVANRVIEITKIMPSEQWDYVNTSQNPADAASRGLYPSQLLKNQSMWAHGPIWLRTFEQLQSTKQSFQTEQEQRHKQALATTADKSVHILDQLLLDHSKLEKIIRIFAWIQRAMPYRPRPQKYLTVQELRNAMNTIVRHVQNNEYGTDIEHLRQNNKISSKSKLTNLNPFLSTDNILRVGGRLSKATVSINMKHPKIIPADSRLAELLIDQAHRVTFHGGPRLTLSTLRMEYWITGGYNTVKKQLRNCLKCRKNEGSTQHQLMGDLPEARSNPAPPFFHTGVDYTGFVEIKTSKLRAAKTIKGYVAVFICMVTKAVHLELVTDLTSSAFLAALRRMASRRGAPQHLYSDNGTNFVGANKALQEAWEQLRNIFNDEFMRGITEMNIQWHFNAPSWPSAGGLWERAVRSLKHHLKRVVGDQKLTFEEYYTILAQIEACLNTRPLCALTENIEDLDYLTPAHFLTGRPGITVMETEEDGRTRWHLNQKIFRDLWKKWKMEYLVQMSARQKWQHPQKNIETGDLVVIHDDNLPAGKWSMGRVTETHPGSDGLVRVVTLKTKNGTVKRPVVKLSVLPLKHNSEVKQETPPQQKTKTNKRPSLSHIVMTLLYFFTFINSGDCFRATNLPNKQGIFFDKIAQMQNIRDEWKIIAYYDLNPYWEGIEAYGKYLKHLNSICKTIEKNTHCEIIVLQLRQTYDDFEHNNQVLLNPHTSAHARQRRGLVNGIGYLANSLFGVLDDRFSEQYQKDIALVRKNQHHLETLWKNQTSIIEAENNLVQRAEEAMQKQHKIINKHLMKLQSATGAITQHLEATDMSVEFALSSMAANNLLTHLRSIQDYLLDTLTSVYSGKLNIHLIDPQQLQNELSSISSQLANEFTLPIENIQTNMKNIYRLLKIKARMTFDYILFEIRVPLVSRDTYELYNLVPVPYQTGRNMITITPVESFVAMNLHKDSYLPVSIADLQHCIITESETYICQLKTPIYKMTSDLDLCIKNNHKENQCKTVSAKCQDKWISLNSENQYLHFCCDTCQIRSLCKDQINAHQLAGSNIIELEPECEIKTGNLTILTYKHGQSEMNITNKINTFQIAPINHVLNLTFDTVKEYNNSILEKSTNEIDDMIRNMRKDSEAALSDELSTHDMLQYSLIYVLYGTALATVIIYGCWRMGRCRRGQKPPAAAAAAATAVPLTTAAVVVVPKDGKTVPKNEQQCSARNECCASISNYNKDIGTSPVLKKVTFARDDN